MIVQYIIHRPVDGLAPVYLAIRVDRMLRMFSPVDQINTGGVHNFLVTFWVFEILAGVENMIRSIMLNDAACPASLVVGIFCKFSRFDGVW